VSAFSIVAAASTFVTILLLVLGFLTFSLLLVTFLFGLLLSFVVLGGHGV
jgi:hypothetical protein